MKIAQLVLIACCVFASSGTAAEKKPRQVTGFVPDGAAEEIFKKADKGKDKLLNDKEYAAAVQYAQQLAASLPPPIAVAGKKDKNNKNNAANAVTPLGNPDLNNDKKVSLEEWKSVFPLIISNTQAEIAKATGATANPKKK